MKNTLRKFLYKFKLTSKLMNLRKRYYDWKLIAYPIIKQKKENPDAVFFALTPESDNIGDHAIAVSTKNILDKLHIKYIEVSYNKLSELKSYGFLNVFNGTTILVNGGGNLGTLWIRVENIFRSIIENNPKSNIICLANTIYYENSDYGISEFENSIKIYNAHKNLVLYAREKISYEIMKNAYKNVHLVPDMVLSLDYSKEKLPREGCLLCLRSDLEKTMTDETRKKIVAIATSIFGTYTFTDTCTSYKISASERHNEFMKKINEIKSANLVITDRLHGMILCAITGTPCIVVNSKSHKIKGCYEWIKNLEYIKLTDNVDEIADLYNSIPKSEFYYDNSSLTKYYNQLEEVLIKHCKKSNVSFKLF